VDRGVFSVSDNDGQVTYLNPEKVSELISYGGALEKLSDTFEQRDSQIELLQKICQAFNEDKIGVFEAGTGVGKSFAYLIPSILWAANNHERVIISTGTINLQQQIFNKDLPLAEKITGKKVKAVLMKGRQNFICRRRFKDVTKENDLFSDEQDSIKQISEWLELTESGNKTDLPFMVQESLWQRINSESDACLGNRCPFKNECFVMKMKKEANDAQIIIVNHHLLFADIEMRKNCGYDDTAVLPPYTRLIFDEAHGMENAATSFFSEGFTKFRVQKQIRLLYRNRKGNQSGLYFSLDALSVEPNDISSLMSQIAKLEMHLQQLEDNAKVCLGKNYTLRLCEQTSPIITDVLESFRQVSMDLSEIIKFFREIIMSLGEDEKDTTQVWEVKQVLSRLEGYATFCTNFRMWKEKSESVFWIENGTFIHFNETPVDISSFLYRGVFEPIRTIICTSATLSISDSFNFWLSRVGIDFSNPRLLLDNFSSPFPYHKNVLFTIPVDVPSPENPVFQSYLEKTLPELILASSGRSLVLFTSYDSLKHAYEASKNYIIDMDINLLKQGDGDRFKLLETFKNDINSVLFATYSFWEGVDVPGESLSQVIIVKLPFGVPSDPVFASRCEDIAKRGGNPFMELSVPEAIIKFKQGFGRLMRRSSDYGVVTVLDKRLIEKFYGQVFMHSIPETKTCIESTSVVCKSIEHFLG